MSLTEKTAFSCINQAPLVQKLDNAIHLINLYTVDNTLIRVKHSFY